MGQFTFCPHRPASTLRPDEFLAYGTVGTLQDARGMLACIRRELERSNREDPWVCKLSVSLGLYAGIPENGEQLDDFLLRADRAMYSDKDRKRHSAAAPLR